MRVVTLQAAAPQAAAEAGVVALAVAVAGAHYCFHLTYNILHFGQPLKISARKRQSEKDTHKNRER